MLGIRTVEWMRDNGARGLVNDVENIYYSLNAPAKGGPALKALPAQAGTELLQRRPRGHAHRVVHVYRPSPIKPVIKPALPGEGVWRATFSHGGTRPPVLVTSFRPDPTYPRTVAGVAWIDAAADDDVPLPGDLRAGCQSPVARPRGGALASAAEARRDLQQRLQDEG